MPVLNGGALLHSGRTLLHCDMFASSTWEHRATVLANDRSPHDLE